MGSPRPLKHADVRSEILEACPAGHARVLRCYPLRTGDGRCEPFPTLFWLACPRLTDALTRLEHAGWVQRLAARLEEDEDFRARVAADHDAYIVERWSLLSDEHRQELERRGLTHELEERGVGGIRNRRSVKCLHLHYAHHLARGSTLGAALDGLGLPGPCAATPVPAPDAGDRG